MSKMSDNILKIREYISFELGNECEFTPIESRCVTMLPLTMREIYELYATNIIGKDVIIAYCNHSNDITPGKLVKHKSLLESKFEKPIVFAFDKLIAYNRQRMIAIRLNIVVPNSVLFFPDLLINIRKERTSTESELIPPMAQCLLLYHLQVESLHLRKLVQIAETLDASYPTITRAVSWLKKRDLIGSIDGVVQINLNNKELWDMALPYLSSPVEKVLYTNNMLSNGMLSGIEAMSEYTMLNPQQYPTLAISKQEAKSLMLNKQVGDYEVQIWRYNPRLLTPKNVVDKLSLYLSMKDTDDERIQIELENLINSIQW